jgi:NAD(P)-dependent dehydrogenase (short-subunit alcohol dehydrogenase family)
MDKQWKSLLAITGGIVATAGIARLAQKTSRHISLRDKVVLITGGSRGLGLVIARELSHLGARVAICARNDRELARVREEFADNGKQIFTEICDVGVRAEMDRCVRNVREALGEIDILINNAGQIVVGPLENQSTEAFEDAMQTNFWGPFYSVLAVSPAMRARRFGRIVNIASIGGKLAFPHLLPYSASKFALVGYSQGLRVEMLKHNVFVTTVCPGLMRTGSPRNADFSGQNEKEYAWFKISDSLPVGSIGAKTAARKIIRALADGDAEVHLGITAKVGAVAQGIAPGLVTDVLGLVDKYLMPEAVPGQPDPQKGSASESEASENTLTQLSREAEIQNNQL